MRRLINNRTAVLVIGIVAILALAVVAASLDSLDLEKGEAFTYNEASEDISGAPAEELDLSWLFLLILAIYLTIAILTLVMASRKQRRLILLALMATALVMVGIMWWISSREPMASEEFVATPTTERVYEVEGSEVTPLPQGTPSLYENPKVSPWLSIGFTFAVLLVVAIVVWFGIRARYHANVPLQAIAGIAEQAVVDLQAGKDYGDAVINCYASMTVALNRQRGIQRRGNLTPAEFIAVLVRAGLPSASTRKLTSLFENVRYGGKQASREQVQEAVECLNQIIAAIRGSM